MKPNFEAVASGRVEMVHDTASYNLARSAAFAFYSAVPFGLVADELNAWVERMHRAGIQVNCHANGDVAIDMYLTAVERAQKLAPRADVIFRVNVRGTAPGDLRWGRRYEGYSEDPAIVRAYASAPLEPGEHYVEFPPEALWVF